ncbi:MAG: hypothetical protein K2N89_10945 [Lachnospiraceae bacterium]|nr:hypothetical protein [Lachnospiraceae bacterium]
METLKKSFKISVATVLAIALADRLGLKYSATAGIITVLSIQNTKRETIWTALRRAGALICAFLLAALCFYMVGYNVAAFAIYLFFFALFCFSTGWVEALAMVSVLVTHFLTEKNMSMESLINEVLLFFIGTLFGVLVNLHLHRKKHQFTILSDEVDRQIKGILHRMSEWLPREDRGDYQSDCFEQLDDALSEAKLCAINNYNNSMFSSDTDEIDYIKMREEQSVILKEVYKNIKGLKYLPQQAVQVAALIRKIEEGYHRENTVEGLLAKTDAFLKRMATRPLPQTREEFEARAVLFYILKQLENVLWLKYDFIMNRQKKQA